ncbi:MAG: CoA pyrophosphatase [Actinomycetota bacterium]
MTPAAGGAGDGTGEPAPGWLLGLADAAAGMRVPPGLQPEPGGRPAAVLVLFGVGPQGPDLLLVQRGPGLRRHSGQAAFPGGAIDPADSGPVQAALREAAEEARVDPAGVQVLTVLPDLFIRRSRFTVTPVLAWWRRPVPVSSGDPVEVVAVQRIPVAELADPAHRLSIRPPSGLAGQGRRPASPAFRAGGMLIWGFTAMVVDQLLTLGGWEVPWDASQPEDLPPGALLASSDGTGPVS